MVSPELYENALMANEDIINIQLHGATLTPPIKTYKAPLGASTAKVIEFKDNFKSGS